jgi:hypothetical protein
MELDEETRLQLLPETKEYNQYHVILQFILKLGTACETIRKKYSKFSVNVPGKLKARPVAQPATPALITANRHVSSCYTFNSKKKKLINIVCILSSFPRSLLIKHTTKL